MSLNIAYHTVITLLYKLEYTLLRSRNGLIQARIHLVAQSKRLNTSSNTLCYTVEMP